MCPSDFCTFVFHQCFISFLIRHKWEQRNENVCGARKGGDICKKRSAARNSEKQKQTFREGWLSNKTKNKPILEHTCITVVSVILRIAKMYSVIDMKIHFKTSDLFNLVLIEKPVMVPVDLVLTTPSLSCVIDRCAGGECDVEEENLRGNPVRLHQTRLGSSKVILDYVCFSLPLCFSTESFKSTPNKKKCINCWDSRWEK